MITAQALCGAAGALIVPSLVALIAENYTGRQQATAVRALGSARAAAGVLAFVIGGTSNPFPRFGEIELRRNDRSSQCGRGMSSFERPRGVSLKDFRTNQPHSKYWLSHTELRMNASLGVWSCLLLRS